MKVIPWEDKNLTTRQQEILIGSLLGDGRLECRSREGTARFRVHHADSQRDLLFWKYQEFETFVHRKPWYTDWYDCRYKRQYRSWFFHTETSSIFAPIHAWFYGAGRKCVPIDIVKHLSKLVLAVWIVDDGCGTPEGLILNTQSFVLREQKILLAALEKRFGVQGTINRDRENFRLRFNREHTHRLNAALRSIEIPTLENKLVPVTTASQYDAVAVARKSGVKTATIRRIQLRLNKE